MDMQSNELEANGPARAMNGRFRMLAIIGSVILVLIVAAIWIPHNMVSRVAHDEVSAMNALRGLTSLETGYARSHPPSLQMWPEQNSQCSRGMGLHHGERRSENETPTTAAWSGASSAHSGPGAKPRCLFE